MLFRSTGIRHRRHCVSETHGSLCAGAARAALDRAGVSPEEIGACVVATVTADTLVPSAACVLQRELGLPSDIPCFDLSAACTGFLFALHTMECLLNASPRKYGLVVGAETLSRVTKWWSAGRAGPPSERSWAATGTASCCACPAWRPGSGA